MACGREQAAHARAARGGVPIRPVKQPRFFAVACGTRRRRRGGARDPPDGVGFPCVVKPLMLSGSRGVMRADDPASLAAALARLERLLADPAVRRPDPEAAGQYLVESFVAGSRARARGHPDPRRAAGAGAVRQAGSARRAHVRGDHLRHAVAAARRRSAPHRRHGGGGGARARPRDRPGSRRAALERRRGGPVLVELAARPSGACARGRLRFESGFSLEDVVVRHALGAGEVAGAHRGRVRGHDDPDTSPHPERAARRRRRRRRPARSPGVDDVVISVRVGETLVPLPEGASYTGFIFASGDTAATVEKALREAHAQAAFHRRAAGGRSRVDARPLPTVKKNRPDFSPVWH